MKFLALNIFFLLSTFLFAEGDSSEHDHSMHDHSMHDDSPMTEMHSSHHSMSHGSIPIGIMRNMHHKGFMLSIKHGRMKMAGNILDGKNISNSEILGMRNPLSNMPANLSIVPKNMDMKMTMIDAMYAPSNNFTFMLMATYVTKDMNLSSYSPMMARNLVGQFRTSASDLSSLTLSGLFNISQTDNSKWHGEISLKESIGKNESTAMALTPMGKKMEMIMPYAMQPGDDSTSLIFGLTNLRELAEGIFLGNQLKRKIVVSEADWSFGDATELSSWIQYSLSKTLSISSRLKFVDTDSLSGRNPLIMAPVQTANPNNYGGKELHLGLGMNLNLDLLPGGKDTIGIEILKPLDQDKNNLQMKTDYQIIIGYQKSL